MLGGAEVNWIITAKVFGIVPKTIILLNFQSPLPPINLRVPDMIDMDNRQFKRKITMRIRQTTQATGFLVCTALNWIMTTEVVVHVLRVFCPPYLVVSMTTNKMAHY